LLIANFVNDDVLADRQCPEGKKRCPGGVTIKCIPEYKFCDGVPDCRRGTDEDPRYCRSFQIIILIDNKTTYCEP